MMEEVFKKSGELVNGKRRGNRLDDVFFISENNNYYVKFHVRLPIR